jgi:hypothetical protein
MFGLMEYNGMDRNRIKWSGMERNGINLPFHCMDILEGRGTKSKVSDGMRWNPFHPIPFHYYLSNPNNGTLFYSIPFHQSKHIMK